MSRHKLISMATADVRDIAADGVAEARDRTVAHGADPPPPRPSKLVVAVLAAALIVPIAIAVFAFHKPTWTPVLDLAQTELRVRDVGTADTPLIGLPGRIGTGGQQGSHPGPLSFYALAPTYRLFGSSAFSLQVASLVVQSGAIVVALLIARRRGGTGLVLGVGAMLALLVTGFGVTALTEPWNPYLPVLWWVVVLLAAWSVACGDIKLLPVVVVAGSFCAQTHVPYLALCLGIGGLAAAGAVLHFRSGEAVGRRSIVVWSAVAVALGVAVWLPPTIDQIIHHPGNESILIRHFTNPPPQEPTVGVRGSLQYVFEKLDMAHLSLHQLAEPGLLVSSDPTRHANTSRGVAFAALWGLAALAAIKLRNRSLLLLHAVVALGVLLLIFDVSHIFGNVWYYLLLPVWGVAGLMTVATVWTVAALVGRAVSADRRELAERVGKGALVAVIALFCARLTWAAPSASHSDALISDELGAVVPDTVAALNQGVGGATGHAGRYLVAWDDAAYIGSPGYGLLNELDRRGFDVGAIAGLRVIATPHRVVSEAEATARVELATGAWVDRWRVLPGAIQVAFIDPRTPVQQARFTELRSEVIALLHERGMDDLIAKVDDNLFGAAIDQRVYLDGDIQPRFNEMLELGVPIGVFIAPPGVHL
ncbi:MAG: hypothetical protein QOI95_2947 [Acidimicrobiaceae bacterium]|jgi:hypothetical protein